MKPTTVPSINQLEDPLLKLILAGPSLLPVKLDPTGFLWTAGGNPFNSRELLTVELYRRNLFGSWENNNTPFPPAEIQFGSLFFTYLLTTFPWRPSPPQGALRGFIRLCRLQFYICGHLRINCIFPAVDSGWGIAR